MCFFFDVTATTETDTYVHTLSLHDALPIYTRPANFLGACALALPAGFDDAGLPLGIQLYGKPSDEATVLEIGPALQRTEEHTSELQSLMRISYAVFCLKKKKKINHRYLNRPLI